MSKSKKESSKKSSSKKTAKHVTRVVHMGEGFILTEEFKARLRALFSPETTPVSCPHCSAKLDVRIQVHV